MGYYLQVDIEETLPLASNTGWGDVRRWADSLPAAPALQFLIEQGWSEHIGDILSDITIGLNDFPPPADTRATLRNLAEILRANRDAQVISVTDGLG